MSSPSLSVLTEDSWHREAADKTIKLWSLPEGKLVKTLKGHLSTVYSVAISPDGKLLASGSEDKTIKLWSLPEGEPSWCLFDPSVTKKDSKTREYRQMGPKTYTLPCGTPTPPGTVCICDCVAGSTQYTALETVCICDTIMVPAGTSLPPGAVCVCNTIAVGTYKPTKPSRSVFPRRGVSPGRGFSPGGTICTCDVVHYWYPN